jgi:SAM-dependent methyltransferase
MRRLRCFAPLLAALLLSLPSTAHTQATPPETTPRPTSTPYTGDLSIFETPGRDKRLQIDRVMNLLDIQPGKSVADVGAGSGWFTVRAAQRVTPGGVVYAEDINPDAISFIRKRAEREHLANITVVQGTPDNPRLPPASVDAVLMLKVYHEVANPSALLRSLRPALRPAAKIGIIDRNGNGANHGLDAPVVIREMGQAGFRLSGRYDFTKADGQDYFLIFTAK